jgi:hypothetical protein
MTQDHVLQNAAVMLLLLMLARMIYNVQLTIAPRKATETTKEKEAINGEERNASD